MEALLIVAIAAALAVAAVTLRWTRHGRRQARGRGASASPWAGAAPAERGTVRLELAPVDPDDAAVRRLALAVARQALADDPALPRVRVVDADGRELVTVGRDLQLPTDPPGPEGTAERAGTAAEEDEPDPARGDQLNLELANWHTGELADRYLLPAPAVAELQQRDDGTELVRAVLTAAGRGPTPEQGGLRVGDVLVIVLGDAHGRGLSPRDLSRAYLHFQSSGARRGLVILLGYVPPAEIRRRESLAPQLHYTGPDAIQRMADAAALGADPLRFVLPGWPHR